MEAREQQDMVKTNKELLEELQAQMNALQEQVNELKKLSSTGLKHAKEILWAEIFKDTIRSSTWYEEQRLSPGRWAAGYPFLYALYRALDEMRPKKILELGLGQTTRLITQYAASDAKVRHTVVEHDAQWISFFQEGFNLANNTTICHLPISYSGTYGDDTEVVAYEGFKKQFSRKKFDMICIDGPFGFLAKIYARTDILTIMPGCLANSFVIFLDDSEREGEKNTIKELKTILEKKNIQYETGTYTGKKDTFVLASPDNKFICSM